MITTEILIGPNILSYAEALGELRIRVFREWPYLYEGSADYERKYLSHYATCADSIVVMVKDGDHIIGASTGLPLTAADSDFQDAFARQNGYPKEAVYYFGESVLLPEYRGRGIGHTFFDHREAHARSYGAAYAAFCAVDRAPDDPRRPVGYRSLDAFWAKRGYTKQPDIRARFSWRELGQNESTENTLTFWLRAL